MALGVRLIRNLKVAPIHNLVLVFIFIKLPIHRGVVCILVSTNTFPVQCIDNVLVAK